jgi:hypothetical protein
MKLKINDLETAYEVLCNFHLLDEDPRTHIDDEIHQSLGEDNPQSQILERLKRKGGLGYSRIELPEPFNFAGFRIHRIGLNYSASLFIAARDPEVFHYSSVRIRDMVKRKYPDYQFVSSTNHGSGYLLDRDRRTAVSVLESGLVRDIGIGCNGSQILQFKDDASKGFENFRIDIGRLEAFGNHLVLDWYDHYIQKHGELEKVPDDLVLNLNFV